MVGAMVADGVVDYDPRDGTYAGPGVRWSRFRLAFHFTSRGQKEINAFMVSITTIIIRLRWQKLTPIGMRFGNRSSSLRNESF
jgi:hypothetical protein